MANEKKGIAFTSGVRQDGWQVSVTARADSPVQALTELDVAILEMIEKGYTPFVSYINKHEPYKAPVTPDELVPPAFTDEDTVVQTAVQNLGAREIPAGHRYLGVKPGKVDDILENDSYDVVASTYTYDGTWVNFYNGNRQSAGYYFANKTSQKIFGQMFPWQPEVVEKAPIPGGNVMLYVLGVNSNGTIYQNIKQVVPA